jgi:hypothetical protein
MKNMAENYAKNIMGGNCYLVIVYLVSIIFLIIFTYSIYFNKELTKSTRSIKEMKDQVEEETNDGSLGSISPLSTSDYVKKYDGKFKYALIDHQVMGSVNSCCTGEVINGYVSLDALKIVLEQGVRLLDFEIYLKDNKVVVAAGRNNIYMKDTYNELEIGKVLSHVKKIGINGVSNGTDPLLLNFRIMSKNPAVYHILEKKITEHLGNYLVNRDYGYGGTNKNDKTKNIIYASFEKLKNKVIIFVDDSRQTFKEYPKFLELVNGYTGAGGNLKKYSDYQIQNEGTPSGYKSESKTKFFITVPNVMEKRNSNWSMHHKYGCQAVLMNFGAGYNDGNMKSYKLHFKEQQKAYLLKPVDLLRRRMEVRKPTGTPQDMSAKQATGPDFAGVKTLGPAI